jgi:hypothetical protein
MLEQYWNPHPLHLYASVKFLVDTGAIRTTISDKDAIRLGIDYASLYREENGMLGIGGCVDTYIIDDARLLFNQADRKQYVEPIESLCILRHAAVNERILRIPSILGRDVLNKYTFVYALRKEKAYITDEPIPI